MSEIGKDGAIETQLLVKNCLAGRQDAVAKLVERFRDQVFGLCFRMVRHVQDAEDMTQESFIRAIRSLHRWDSQRPFAPWLLAIAGNRCRTLLAKRAKRPWDAEAAILEDAAGGARPNDSLSLEFSEELELALNSLRAEHRTAFLLFHQQTLSYEEIAAALDRPVGTIKTWVHRARRSLCEQFLQRGVVEESSHDAELRSV